MTFLAIMGPGIIALRAYLVIAALLLLIKAIQLGTG